MTRICTPALVTLSSEATITVPSKPRFQSHVESLELLSLKVPGTTFPLKGEPKA